VPYLCHYLLAVILVFCATIDAMYMIQKAMDGVLTLNWPLKVCPSLLLSSLELSGKKVYEP